MRAFHSTEIRLQQKEKHVVVVADGGVVASFPPHRGTGCRNPSVRTRTTLNAAGLTTPHKTDVVRWHKQAVDNPYTALLDIVCQTFGYHVYSSRKRKLLGARIIQMRRWRKSTETWIAIYFTQYDDLSNW